MELVGQTRFFNLYIEQVTPAHYWGCIDEIPFLSRVVGDNLQDVSYQLMVQIGYLVVEMGVNCMVKINTKVKLQNSKD